MGCGCNSNFSGQKKQCTCGRNAGGNCNCNNSTENKTNFAGRKNRKPMNFSGQAKDIRRRTMNFMGANKFPNVNTKKYGIPEDQYYEYNSFDGQRGINFNDLKMDF